MKSPADSSDETAQRIAGALVFWQALCGLVLFAVTWRLWWPGSDFPQIPWFAWGCRVPTWVDAVACVVLGGSLVALCLSLSTTSVIGSRSRFKVGERAGVGGQLVGCILLSLGLLVLLDQHRLQPWVWQMLLWCVVFFATPTTMLRCLRWLTVSVYFWSGVSKLDAAFTQLDSHGWLLLDGLTRALRIDTQFWSPETMSNVARVFPWGELLVAVWLGAWMLIARVTDRGETVTTLRWPLRMLQAGCWAAIAMHLVLMLIVGPLGLNHEPGVLVWNLFFIGQAWLLFGRRDVTAIRMVAGHRTMSDHAIVSFTLIATIFPLLSCWGWCDHWPAWSVYSSRPAIVEVWVDTDAAEDLPPELQSFLAPAPPLETQQEFNLDAWSYRELGCPLYPQERYRLALARAVIDCRQLADDAMIRIESAPNWWTGERQVEELNAADLRQRLSRYHWNTQVR